LILHRGKLLSWTQGLQGTWIGGIIRGIVKIALAAVIATILGNVNLDLSNVTIGSTTVNLEIVWDVIVAFGPLLLVLSGLRDIGVRL
jgi:hypothetical protein